MALCPFIHHGIRQCPRSHGCAPPDASLVESKYYPQQARDFGVQSAPVAESRVDEIDHNLVCWDAPAERNEKKFFEQLRGIISLLKVKVLWVIEGGENGASISA